MNNSIGIIPLPIGLIESGGTVLLEPGCGITFDENSEKAGLLLIELLNMEKVSDGFIKLLVDSHISNPEEYKLLIDHDGITITAGTQAGLFYGAQSLRLLLPMKVEKEGLKEPIEIPCLMIHDSPKFKYRGFMLDCARHFIGIDTIKILLDIMAMHKMNRFHWHLTDDQGFRIQIDKYPLLNQIGSFREESQTSGHFIWGGHEFDGKPHGGFYTKDDIREIVYYASERFIEVIPEIDIPCHSTAMLAAYPEYGCSKKDLRVGTRWGIYKDLICAGKESSYDFIQDVLDEIIPLFPFKHIHLGGDETPLNSWKKCPDCRAMIEKKGLADAKGLKSYFMNKIIKYLKGRNVSAIVWDEAADGVLDEDAIVQYWSPMGKKRATKSLSSGNRMIVSPFANYYLDYTYEMIPLRKTYDFNPYSVENEKNPNKLIIGVEAPLWTEYVSDNHRLFWQVFPRMSAISETAWSGKGTGSYDNFSNRFRQLSGRLDLLGAGSASPSCYGYDGNPKRLGLIFSKKHISDLEYEKYNI